MDSWRVQDAKARFSELRDATIEKGPQVVTRRGVEWRGSLITCWKVS